MSLLLKTAPLPRNRATEAFVLEVSQQKSAKDLGTPDIGSPVYVWVADGAANLSHLELKAELLEVTRTQIPQKRDPTKSIAGYRIRLQPIASVARPLRTDDLLAFRTDDAWSPMHELGRMHADRNGKITRPSDWTIGVLEARFRPGL